MKGQTRVKTQPQELTWLWTAVNCDKNFGFLLTLHLPFVAYEFFCEGMSEQLSAPVINHGLRVKIGAAVSSCSIRSICSRGIGSSSSSSSSIVVVV